jgi:hypothetical protein
MGGGIMSGAAVCGLNRDPLLTCEEFWKEMGSFHLHFNPMPFFDFYRETPAYRKCMQKLEFQALVKELETISKLGGNIMEATTGHKSRLYKAYVFMYPYAESNDQLFK